jgi:hypothetical protein
VIEHCEECGDKNDGGQNSEGEDSEWALGITKPGAEDEDGAIGGVAQHGRYFVGGPLKNNLPDGPLDDQEGEEDLKTETPDDSAPTYRAASSRKGVANANKNSKSNQSSKSAQRVHSCEVAGKLSV